jgi:hypothetical protein
MENIVARNQLNFFLAAVLLVAAACPAHACKLALQSKTSGFFLSPTLEKVVVAKVTPSPGKPCSLMAGDELLQVNDRAIPGAKAKDIMAYWKGLPEGSKPTFKVRRAGKVVTIASK